MSAETILAAYRIGEYFRANAINAFAEMGANPDVSGAVYLLNRIRRLGEDELSERDIHVACQSRFPLKADMMPALRRLVAHGWLTPLPPPKSTGGRPPSQRYIATEAIKHTEGGR